jgi:predicted O-methyltransferase YrrM
MNEARRAFLDELYAHGREHDAARADRLQRLRNVEPETAELLGVLVRALGARRVLEIGTSNGYSTIWLADAALAVGGAVVSLEIEPERTQQALANLTRAGVKGAADLRTQDAAQALPDFADASWDLIFLDAERPAYVGYWPDLLRVLVPRGLLVVDNALSHAKQLVDFSELVYGAEGVTSTLLTVGAGVLLVVKSA